jgi:hypothetical protein
MADQNFRRIRSFIAPRWLTEGLGGLVGYALDTIRDAYVERVRLGLLARFPQNGPNGEVAPADALQALGRDRRVIRGLNETDQAYALRLLAWLDDRKTAGNPYALMQKIAEYLGTSSGFVIKTVDVAGNWYVRAADGTRTAYLKQANWHWDDESAQWSRFWVVLHPNGFWAETPFNWGDTSGPGWGKDDGHTIGSTATYDEVQTIRAIVADWKPAGTKCINIVVALDPDSFDPTAPVDSTGMPDGLWWRWSKVVADVQVPARLDTARYWDGS